MPGMAHVALDGEVVRLSRLKAEAAQALHPAALCIGSDTMVTIDGLPLGRPKGSSAKRLKLSGKEELIESYIRAGLSKSEISRRLNVCSRTLSIFLDRSAAPEKPL